MRLQSAILRESFRTVLTSVGPLSCVFVHMSLEVPVLGEGLGTHLALVGLVIAVDQQVTLKMAVANKRR